MNDYTHYKWVIRDKEKDEVIRTIVAKNEDEAYRKIDKNKERVAEQIGGMNLTKK